MVRLIAKIMLSAALVMMPLYASSLPEITLDQALQSARSNNLSLESARVTLSQTMRNENNVMSTFMPSISLTGGIGSGMDFPTDSSAGVTFPGMSVNAGVSAGFSFVGSMIKDSDLRGIRKQAADLTYQSVYDSIEYSVISSYWNVAARISQLADAQASYENAKSQYESALAMFEGGIADELAMRQSEQGMNTAEITLLTCENGLNQEKENFKLLTGITGDFTTETIPAPVFLALSADELYSRYSEGTISLQQARNNLAAAIASKENTVLTSYIPTLTANVSYSYAGLADGTKYANRTNGLSGSISVSIPISGILPGGTADSAIKDSTDAVTLATIALNDTQDNLYQDILSYTLEITQLQSQIKAAETGVEIAQRTYDLTGDAFEAGISTASDYSDARTALLSNQTALLVYQVQHLLDCYALATTLNIDLAELQARYIQGE